MNLHNPHIFYSDDDEDDQLLFRDALSEVDDRFSLTTADDGDELLQLLESPPPVPRLIFLDLNMPRVNGYQALAIIRGDERMDSYPVIIFSTSSGVEAVEKTRALGANLFIQKPRSYEGMKQAIRTCVGIDWKEPRTDRQPFLMRFN